MMNIKTKFKWDVLPYFILQNSPHPTRQVSRPTQWRRTSKDAWLPSQQRSKKITPDPQHARLSTLSPPPQSLALAFLRSP